MDAQPCGKCLSIALCVGDAPVIITDIQKTMATAGLCLTAALAIFGGLYHTGAEAGRTEVQAQFDAYKLAEAKQLEAVRAANASEELRHRQETAAIEDQLRKTEADHEATVLAIRADLSGRLHASEQRAAVYRRLSEAGPAERDLLASHTAELDRALEQGVGLVGELQAAVGQRDDELRAVGAKLISDRDLMGVH